jgi:hypothetical protein
MAAHINAVNEAIKRAGPNSVRVVPMKGERFDGKHQIEVRDGARWTMVADGLSQRMATEMIQQASNRLICG